MLLGQAEFFDLCPSLYILSLISKGSHKCVQHNVQNLSLELTHAYLTSAILISIGVLPATSGKNEGGM